jgi:hypothetical protein
VGTRFWSGTRDREAKLAATPSEDRSMGGSIRGRWAGKKVLFFRSYDHGTPVQTAIVEAFTRMGAAVSIVHPPRDWGACRPLLAACRDSHAAIIWHGHEPGGFWARRVFDQHGLPWVVAENGLLPQKGHYHFDRGGIGSSSTLCGALDWVTDADLAALAAWKTRAFGGQAWVGGGGYVVCPLQLSYDASIYMDSPYLRFEEYLRRVLDDHPDREVVWTPHPRNRGQRIEMAHPRLRVERQLSTIELARKAEAIVGLNSTVLLETAALGCPSTALARCPLYYHQGSTGETDRLLAACLRRQVPVEARTVEPWLEAVGFEPR